MSRFLCFRRPKSFILPFFALTQVVFGLAFLFMTPPFQGPDEINHLYRAYAVSTGEWIPEHHPHSDRRGGWVPESLTATADAFRFLRWYGNRKTDWAAIVELRQQPLAPEHRVFVDYPNTAVYPAPVYWPAALGLWLARTLDVDVLTTIWLARGSGLLWWLIFGLLSLWLMPAWHNLALALLLLPMSVFGHSMVTADTYTNAMAWVALGYILHLAFRVERINWSRLVLLMLIGVLLASGKLVYAPLMVLALLIPARKFAMAKGKLVAGALLVGLMAGTLMYWANSGQDTYLPYSEYAVEYRDGLDLPPLSNAHDQRTRLLKQPWALIEASWKSLSVAAPMYVPGFIGTFGWLDTPLPKGLIVAAYAWLFLLAYFDQTTDFRLTGGARWLLVSIILLCYLLIIFSQLLSWEPVGSTRVGTIQGRYLIPLGLLFFLLFTRRGTRPSWLPGIGFFAAITWLSFSLPVLCHRYYQIPNPAQNNVFYCDMENRNRNFLICEGTYSASIDSDEKTQSEEMSRSGEHAVKVDGDHRYNLALHLYDCEPGDTLQASVWRFGNSGILIAGSRSLPSFMEQVQESDSATVNGWQRLQLLVVLPATFAEGEELTVYVYTPDEQINFFDDLEVVYKRHQSISD